MGKLTKRQVMTLREMVRYSGRPYYFRLATSRELVALGLAEPTRDDLVRPPHRITAAGRAALASEEGR